jgi:tRNA-modifying protein YgfZ
MNEEAVYEAVRCRAGVFDRSAEGRLEVRGADRAAWLQGLLTNDIAALAPGCGCYAAYLTPQGRMIADVRVLALADRLLLDVPEGLAASLQARLDLLVIMEDVVVTDVTDAMSRLAVHGPESASMVAFAFDEARILAGDFRRALADGLREPVEHASVTLRLAPGLVAADDETNTGLAPTDHCVVATSRELGLPGLDLYVAARLASRLHAALIAVGAAQMDEATWHRLRVEAGRPRFGVDMTDETIPLEAGIEDRAISFTKGCYVGQEIIVRVRDRGQGRVARRLVGLTTGAGFTDASVLPAGTRLFAGSRDIGHVTSVTWSPALSRVVALGYVQRDHVEIGTHVEADTPAGRVELSVTELPFVEPSTEHLA